LQELNLSYNRIHEIKGLDNLYNLSRLDLAGNQIKDIKHLFKLTSLRLVILYGNDLYISQLERLQDKNNKIKILI